MGKNALRTKVEENQLPVDENRAEPVNTTEENSTGTSKKEETKEQPAKNKAKKNIVKSFLDGSILRHRVVIRSIPLILLVLMMLIFIVAVRYKIENTSKQIEDLKKELKMLKVKQVGVKLKYMHAATLTEISKALDSTGIEQSTDRPKKILLKKESQSKK